jgi:hypothetical protein
MMFQQRVIQQTYSFILKQLMFQQQLDEIQIFVMMMFYQWMVQQIIQLTIDISRQFTKLMICLLWYLMMFLTGLLPNKCKFCFNFGTNQRDVPNYNTNITL